MSATQGDGQSFAFDTAQRNAVLRNFGSTGFDRLSSNRNSAVSRDIQDRDIDTQERIAGKI